MHGPRGVLLLNGPLCSIFGFGGERVAKRTSQTRRFEETNPGVELRALQQIMHNYLKVVFGIETNSSFAAHSTSLGGD